MKKILLSALCGAVAFAMVTPAFADHQIGGYYRVQGVMQNQTLSKDANPVRGVDQRLRARWQNNINEYVTVVWFGEVDTKWGSTSKGDIGGGGKVGADGVNVKTKHAYADLKLPNTPVSARVGIQGFGGNFDGLVVNDDMAGLMLSAKMDAFSASALWSKWDEGDAVKVDDTDFYALVLDLKPMGDLNLGLDGYWLADQNDPGDSDNYYWVGVRGAFKMAPVSLSGWFLYHGGQVDSAADGAADETQAWAATLRGGFALAGADMGLRFIYVSPVDDEDILDPKFGQGAFEFYGENSQIFLADVYYNNFAGGRHAFTDAAYKGYGLYGISFSGKFVPPAMKQLYLKWNAGYYMAADDKPEGRAEMEGKDLGGEVSGQVGMIVAGNADLSLRGAYGFLGSFYDKTAGGEDPDDLYNLVAMLNISY